jgi:hypothetical protein
MKKIEVSLFLNCWKESPIQTINLWDWLTKKSPYMDIVDEIRSSNDRERIKYLKTQLPAITPSGVFSVRKSDKLKIPTNIICIDIDGKDNPDIADMEVLKSDLSKLPYIMYCGLSASGKGLFCLIRIADYQKHINHFYALENEFASMNIVIDSSCKDIGRLRFYSYDFQPYINPESEIYTQCTEPSFEKSSPIRLSTHQEYYSNSTNIPNHKRNTVYISPEEAFLRSTIDERVMMVHFSNGRQMAVYDLIKRLVSLKIDITGNYSDWIKICIVIANQFKEQGRGLFQEISSFYPHYTRKECDTLFTSILPKEYPSSYLTIFDIAKQYGIS